MTTFDSNVWYQLVFGNSVNATYSVVADINNSGTGGIIQTTYNASYPTRFHWQVVKLSDPDVYGLRSRYLGNTWMMGTFWQPLTSLPNMDTRIRSENYRTPDLAPKSAQWLIQPAGDGGTGLYFLSTVANGTGWHLESLGNVGYLRDASGASSTGSMRWGFSSVSAINDATWSWTASSTSSSATATSTSSSRTSGAPASASASATSVISASPIPSSGSGSSTPVGAIAGGVIGGIAVLLLIFGLIFYFRRKRRSSPNSTESNYSAAPPYQPRTELEGRQPVFSERYGTAVKTHPGLYEKPSPQEEKDQPIRNWNEVVELPAQEYGNYRR